MTTVAVFWAYFDVLFLKSFCFLGTNMAAEREMKTNGLIYQLHKQYKYMPMNYMYITVKERK